MNVVAVHRMLLRLAGLAPDRLLAKARVCLVAADLQTVCQAMITVRAARGGAG